MVGHRTPSRASSIASQDISISQNAAVQGASLAFGRPLPKPRAPSNTYAGVNGALAAATSVGDGRKTPSLRNAPGRSPGFDFRAGSSTSIMGSDTVEYTPSLEFGATRSLAVPQQQRECSKSPSHSAAALATARASPSSAGARQRAGTTVKANTKPLVVQKPRCLSDQINKLEETPDERSVSTTSLVNIFERKSTGSQSEQAPNPIIIDASNSPAIRSPKPTRTSDGISSIFRMELGERRAPQPVAIDIAQVGNVQYDGQSDSDAYVSASEDTAPSPSPPLAVRKRDTSDPSRAVNARSTRPSPPPLRSVSPDGTDIKPPPRSITSPEGSMSLEATSFQSTKSIAAAYHQMYPRRMTPLTTGDQLANAMVASSLASSRVGSPGKLEALTVPTRRQKGNTFSFSRTPSPAKKGMRHTMRKEERSSSESEDEIHPYGKHKKKRLVRKHPNKHHEGDRKRWQEAVTERERKRYEGIWAANKGLYHSFTAEEEQSFRLAPEASRPLETKEAASEQVSNIIARDIWSRSRLPSPLLESIWNLVDSQCVGRLNKEEFVVGMWLIDQRLKGRKLPVQVSDSVWASVRGVGLKVRK